MAAVKQDAVQEIKDRLDLVDLISEHLRLQKAGRDLKGLCPFHQEKTPSLYVSPEKQLWHCYGCQKGGDHFTFIQDIEHVDFRGALRLLAEKTGVVLEESPGAGRQRELKRTISKLNLLAVQYFHHILLENPAGQRALIQLESRGVTRASMWWRRAWRSGLTAAASCGTVFASGSSSRSTTSTASWSPLAAG